MSSEKMNYLANIRLGYNGPMDWAKKIRNLRMRNNLSQKEFAERGQTSMAQVRAIESGARHASIVTLENLLKGVGSSLPEFFQSKVLEHYTNPSHQYLHEMFQEILEEQKFAEGIILNVEAIHSFMMKTKGPLALSKSLSEEEEAGSAEHQRLAVMDSTKTSRGRQIDKAQSAVDHPRPTKTATSK